MKAIDSKLVASKCSSNSCIRNRHETFDESCTLMDKSKHILKLYYKNLRNLIYSDMELFYGEMLKAFPEEDILMLK
ncbi:hypothetical protein SAMN00790413_04692 [Deinococcus hopiensis KR-140]|uniref:Uncharacterized protein n=1 Tax=Deinococcus hopiensis KR-140 TaxID=695939 RepID=A0A1W1UKU7_9DEIO|nr:hypothetical protein SAMN00790413_04692 [Deinococcus hopiensis KR-140]